MATLARSKRTGAQAGEGRERRLRSAIKNVEGLSAPCMLNGKHMHMSDLRSAAPGGRLEGPGCQCGVHPRGGGAVTGNENSQMLTEKHVKFVRFHWLYSGRKNGTSSEAIARETMRKKGVLAEFQELKAEGAGLKHNNDVSQ